jgi:hypothetical protein
MNEKEFQVGSENRTDNYENFPPYAYDDKDDDRGLGINYGSEEEKYNASGGQGHKDLESIDKPLDPYAIPDDEGSLDPRKEEREYDNLSLAKTPKAESLATEEKKFYSITNKEVERICDTTGQSRGTVLLERHLTEEDVNPSE